MNNKVIPFPQPTQPKKEEARGKNVVLTPLSQAAIDNLYDMQGPECAEGEHEFVHAEVNSYGVMIKCTKCGAIDWRD